jgi:uncharacterized protein YbjT (DUF2867 family)
MEKVFITGATGYIGRRLVKLLLENGCSVKALVRPGSQSKLPREVEWVIADPFDGTSFSEAIPPGCTFIHLLGVPHPGPSKRELFKSIDLASVKAACEAAKSACVKHFIYISVAQTPTRIMHDYQECRREGEKCLAQAGLPVTIFRPWYVVGPGHYWPLLFLPLFKILELVPQTAIKAKSLRLVTLKQLLNALVSSVNEISSSGIKIIEIDSIRKMGKKRPSVDPFTSIVPMSDFPLHPL